MFGEADAINTLTDELTRTLRESTALLSSALEKLNKDLVFVINDSARSRDKHLAELTKSILKLDATLNRYFPPPIPGRLRLIVTGELGMANMLGFKILLPELPPEPNDIASGELTVQIGQAEAQVIATTKQQTEVVDLAGEQGATVDVSYVYIDDAGNRSVDASTIQVVLTDTIPPANPGALGVEVTSEFTTDDVPPGPEEPAPPGPEEPV